MSLKDHYTAVTDPFISFYLKKVKSQQKQAARVKMKAYSTYQEAKIANPECEVAIVTRVDANTPALGMFISVVKNCKEVGGYSFSDRSREGYPNITDGYYTICNPADYCMTVEKFLADGHKFVDGDLILDEDSVYLVADDKTQNYWYETESANKPDCDDGSRHILCSAALEEKEPELTKDDSPQGILSSISNRLHNVGCEHQNLALGHELSGMACDIWGVLPLISNESIQEKKPRTKVEHVKCEFDSAWEAVKDFEDGKKLYTKRSHKDYILIDNAPDVLRFLYDLHKRIETETDERHEFIDVIEEHCNENGFGVNRTFLGSLFDSGKFKLVK